MDYLKNSLLLYKPEYVHYSTNPIISLWLYKYKESIKVQHSVQRKLDVNTSITKC